jgi:hypothetical protein
MKLAVARGIFRGKMQGLWDLIPGSRFLRDSGPGGKDHPLTSFPLKMSWAVERQ